VAANIVYISREYHADDKQRDSFTIGDCHWISGTMPTQKELKVKLRHGKHFHTCIFEGNAADNSAYIKLAERDQGIAAGQFAVFYDGNRCLGSGVIESTD